MITEDYVSFETAKLLKEKGFDGECSRFYMPNGHGRWKYEHYHDFDISDRIECPTLQMAMKWLREEKYIPIEILWHYDSNSGVEEWYFVHHAELKILPNDIEYYESYEQACEAAIKYCLENLI